jgi:hypothetical protein
MQELTLTRAQVTAATTPRRLVAFVTPPPQATAGEVPREPLFLPKHP